MTPRKLLVVAGFGLATLGFAWVTAGVQAAREAVVRSECFCHLKWIAVGLLNHADRHGGFPEGAVPNPTLPPSRRLSWVVGAFDELTSGVVLQVDRSKPCDDPANDPPRIVAAEGNTFVGMSPADVVDFVKCPADPATTGPVPNTDDTRRSRPLPLSYLGVAGVGADAPDLPRKHPRAGVFGYDRVTPASDITDGTSNTLLVAESEARHGPWTSGGSSILGVDPARRPHLGPRRDFGGYHPGVTCVAMADGSVRVVRNTVDPRVFEAAATVAGGETLPRGW